MHNGKKSILVADLKKKTTSVNINVQTYKFDICKKCFLMNVSVMVRCRHNVFYFYTMWDAKQSDGGFLVQQTLAGNINSPLPFILSRLKLNISVHSLRNVEFLHLSTCHTDYSKYEPINRMIRYTMMITDVNDFPGFAVSLSLHAL